jgi:hypothetical protein
MMITDTGGGAAPASASTTPVAIESAANEANPPASLASSDPTPGATDTTPSVAAPSDSYTPQPPDDATQAGSTPNFDSWLGDDASNGPPAANSSPAGAPTEQPDTSAHDTAVSTQNQQLSQFPSSTNADGTISYSLPDGSTITVSSDGSSNIDTPMGTRVRSVINPNGSSTQTSDDGTSETFDTNGDTTTVTPGVSTSYYSHASGATTTSYEDGTTITRQPDGSVTTEAPDGSVSTQVTNANGSKTTTDSDGTVTTVDPNGTRTVIKPGGYSTQTGTNGVSVSQFPDGTQLVEGPTGDQVVTAPNGTTTSVRGTKLAQQALGYLPTSVQQALDGIDPSVRQIYLQQYQANLENPSIGPKEATSQFVNTLDDQLHGGVQDVGSVFGIPGIIASSLAKDAGAPAWLQQVTGLTANLLPAVVLGPGDLAENLLAAGAGLAGGQLAARGGQALGLPADISAALGGTLAFAATGQALSGAGLGSTASAATADNVAADSLASDVEAEVQGYGMPSGTSGSGSTPLTSAQQEALQAYQDGSYDSINSGLRSGQPLGAYYQKDVDLIDSALQQSPTSQPMTLYRGVPDPILTLEQAQQMAQTGALDTDPAFLSTSTNPEAVAEGYAPSAGGVIYEITVPAGTNAIDMNQAVGNQYFAWEREYLLPRDLPRQVTGAFVDEQGRLHVQERVVR